MTVLDKSRAGLTTALADERTAARAVAASRRKGYLDGRSLAEVFAWLRPGDLVWNYWVNNYLEGKPPPRFDILYWNADTTRMTATLHRDFVDVALHNRLVSPGGVTCSARRSTCSGSPSTPTWWRLRGPHLPLAVLYRSSQLLGGKVRFVLSTNGHIAALVNPPSNPKSSYRVADDNTPEAGDWAQDAPTETGSWWPDFASWLGERSGEQKPAPTELGNQRFQVLEDAPGSYVLDS